jgi:non-lysosomal glucosylceramidase
MSFDLFDVPEAAVPAAVEPPFPVGGLGAGHFVWDDAGAFRGWRLQSGCAEVDAPVRGDRFHLWWKSGDRACSAPLTEAALTERRRLFPLTWTRFEVSDYQSGTPGPSLEAVSFSPLLPGENEERSLPVHVVSFRARNNSSAPMEVALMLTWEPGWPDRETGEWEYDFQHDNLCLTGAFGPADSANRQGIGVPDLHYVGEYQQGVQWGGIDDAVARFALDGEFEDLDPDRFPTGAAAWLKFGLGPGETKEAPFVIAWHFPAYQSGPSRGKPRYYTQFLGRHRPDNAIVWLAEQAFQHFGAETANYLYWLQDLRDWQDASGRGAVLNGLSEILRADVSWTEERGVEVASLSEPASHRLAAARVADVWPDLEFLTDSPIG